MADKRPSGKLAVILHADIAGSTAMVQQDEHLAHERIQDAFRRFSDIITRYHGYVRELRGDALLAEFERASDAVTAALAFQADQTTHNAQFDDSIRPSVRVGIAMGEVVIADNTVTGAGVVLAQRIEQLAEPGGVTITAAIHEALPQRMPYYQENLGEQPLKGFDEPVRVYRVELSPGASVPPPQEDSPRQKAPGKRNLVIAIGVLALIIIGGTFYWLRPWSPLDEPAAVESEKLPLPDRPSIAVLPFDNLSDDTSQEYFADGLTDDLITDLSKVSGLFVIARNSVFTFKGKPVRIKTVAEELGVRYVVEGSVRRAGNRVRVNAQLIEGRTGHHVWAERYDGETTDIFALQDELVGQIVSALAVQLTRTEETQLTQRPVPEFEAYELYLRARDGYFSRDQARMRQSLDLYVEATEVDPTFARAYAGLAQLTADVWLLGSVREMLSGAVAKKIAEDAARKALELDPTLPDTHSVIALLRLAEGKHDKAVQSARQAVDLDPNSADAHTALGIALGYAGQPEAALDAIRTAIRLNPRPLPYLTTYYGWVLFLNRKYDEAIAVLKPIASTRYRGLSDAPREILAMAYAELDLVDEAHAQVEFLLKEEPFLNLAYHRLIYDSHHLREEDLQHRLAALRKAGMPEWPLSFQGDPAQRLTGSEMKDLISGKTWTGMDVARNGEFVQEFGIDGNVVYAGPASLLNGKAFVKKDELCEQFEGFILSRALCGAVYRNPDGTPDEKNEYIYVNPTTVRYFSL